MRIRWTEPAALDLEAIKNYLQRHYPSIAQPTVLKIYETVRSLKKFPYRGRIGRRNGTRELVLTPLPYIIVYWVKDDAVEVLHVHHGARHWYEEAPPDVD